MHVNPRIAALLQALNNPSLPGIDLSLERMEQLLGALGNPQKKLPPTIHVAGTNGKGSTIAYLRSIYETAGYRVHAYTSPHLVRFNERILLAGHEISDEVLLEYLERIAQASNNIEVTFFEATTALALLTFAEHPADILLLEVGLGGRLDATNLAENIVASVLTPIAIDHSEFLGDTLAHIAQEKAGIMRADVPCVIAPQQPDAMTVLRARAQALGVTLHHAHAFELGAPSLHGQHQRANASLAASVVGLLQPQFSVNDDALRQGVAQARWPARLQTLTHGPLVVAWGERGPVVLDGGHNAHAATAMAAWLAEGHQPAVMICGLMRRKDATAFLAPLQSVVSRFAFIPIPDAPDSYDPAELAAHIPGAIACASVQEAASVLADVGKATLLVGGSLYLAGEILKNHG